MSIKCASSDEQYVNNLNSSINYTFFSLCVLEDKRHFTWTHFRTLNVNTTFSFIFVSENPSRSVTLESSWVLTDLCNYIIIGKHKKFLFQVFLPLNSMVYVKFILTCCSQVLQMKRDQKLFSFWSENIQNLDDLYRWNRKKNICLSNKFNRNERCTLILHNIYLSCLPFSNTNWMQAKYININKLPIKSF